MADTEDIITGDLPEEQTIHFAEQHLLLFRNEELLQLFAVLKKYYEDSVEDTELLRLHLIELIERCYNNAVIYINEIKDGMDVEFEEYKTQLHDLIVELIDQSLPDVEHIIDERIDERIDTKLEDVNEAITNIENSLDGVQFKQVTSPFNS